MSLNRGTEVVAPYPYHLDREQLARLVPINPGIQLNVENDAKGDDGKNQLKKDIPRDFFKINGKSIPTHFTLEEFEAYLRNDAQFSDQNIQWLFRHYCQNPSYMMVTPFKNATEYEASAPDTNDWCINIYEQDGVLYYETTRTKFAIHFLNQENETISIPCGDKTRALHRLSETGFELLDVSSFSKSLITLLTDNNYTQFKADLLNNYLSEVSNQHCNDLKNDIEEIVKKEIPQVYECYCNTVVWEKNEADNPRPVIQNKFNVNLFVDDEKNEVTKNLYANNKQFRVTVDQYKATRELSKIPAIENKTSFEKLNLFEQTFDRTAHVIAQNRDSKTVLFLKCVASVFLKPASCVSTTALFYYSKLWYSKGTEVKDELKKVISTPRNSPP